jgi:hypothetical protein
VQFGICHACKPPNVEVQRAPEAVRWNGGLGLSRLEENEFEGECTIGTFDAKYFFDGFKVGDEAFAGLCIFDAIQVSPE